jgi:hypothetical protein
VKTGSRANGNIVAGSPERRVRNWTLRNSSLTPYLVVGFSICFLAQLIFWLRLGDVGLAEWPFVWAYSQAATLESVIGRMNRLVYGLVWCAEYLALAVLLWLVLERWRPEHRRAWWRSVWGWLSVELFLGALAWTLLARGIIQME